MPLRSLQIQQADPRIWAIAATLFCPELHNRQYKQPAQANPPHQATRQLIVPPRAGLALARTRRHCRLTVGLVVVGTRLALRTTAPAGRSGVAWAMRP